LPARVEHETIPTDVEVNHVAHRGLVALTKSVRCVAVASKRGAARITLGPREAALGRQGVPFITRIIRIVAVRALRAAGDRARVDVDDASQIALDGVGECTHLLRPPLK